MPFINPKCALQEWQEIEKPKTYSNLKQIHCAVWYQELQKENRGGQLLKRRKRVTDSGGFYSEGLCRIDKGRHNLC